MSDDAFHMDGFRSRGDYWFSLLAGEGRSLPGLCPSVRAADVISPGGETTRYIAVVPDPENAFPRARSGEVGLLEGWTLASVVSQAVEKDREADRKRALVAVVDVTSQAYGRREEGYGIHQALAGAAGAYARARLAGHPVIGLIVGKAMSGAFLAHGYQANRLIAFNDPGVMTHAMGKAAAARITLRSVEDLEALAESIPPMAYDIQRYATFGLLWRLLDIDGSRKASPGVVSLVRKTIEEAIRNIDDDASPNCRFTGAGRKKTAEVRALMCQQW